MLESLRHYFERSAPTDLARDLLDVFIVYYIFYRLLLVARGTRAMQIAAGLGIVALLYVAAQAIGLITIVTLVGSLLQSIILVIVVVFQNDIRRALERVGSRAIFGNLGRAQETEVIDEVVEAARELARHRIGAIITFEQDANLDEFVGQNKGIDVDAKVSAELLVSLFIPEGSNKLHDGAVIIRSLRIAKAGVFFPMPEGRVFDSSFGSRHRAALGITEETDAVVIVVSEERGTISFCFNGNIASDLQSAQLKQMLISIMNPKVRKKSRKAPRQRTPSEPHTPVERVSLKTPIPALTTTQEETPAPPSARPSASSVPPPLRKSALPPEPTLPIAREPESSVPPPLRKSSLLIEATQHDNDESGLHTTPERLNPRPMPKGEVEIVQDPEAPDDSARPSTPDSPKSSST